MNSTILHALMDQVTSAVIAGSSSPAPAAAYSLVWGYVAVMVAAVFFGCNFVPVKKFETGDGLFYQWVLCISIWLTGWVLNGIRSFPEFQPWAMLGGFLWCTGNLLTVPIIKTIGLSQGFLIWASVNLLAGWASSRFGWFGMMKQIPASEVLNYVGIAFCLVSAIVYMFLKTEAKMHGQLKRENDMDNKEDGVGNSLVISEPQTANKTIYDRCSPLVKRIFGTSAAIIAGFLYGVNFVPVIRVQEMDEHASKNGLDYVFSHFCGILASSTFYMVVYCGIMRNRPHIYPKVILPAVASGIMWAIADISWFVANDVLSQTISFPIITTIPGIISALWGVFVFHEIKGRRNYIILVGAIVLAVVGSVLTGLSRVDLSSSSDTDSNSTIADTTPTSSLTSSSHS